MATHGPRGAHQDLGQASVVANGQSPEQIERTLVTRGEPLRLALGVIDQLPLLDRIDQSAQRTIQQRNVTGTNAAVRGGGGAVDHGSHLRWECPRS